MAPRSQFWTINIMIYFKYKMTVLMFLLPPLYLNSCFIFHKANPPGAAGLPAESRLAARHVPAVAGQLSGQRLPGGQGEGSRYWEPTETAAKRSNQRLARVGQDSGHHKQPTGSSSRSTYLSSVNLCDPVHEN